MNRNNRNKKIIPYLIAIVFSLVLIQRIFYNSDELTLKRNNLQFTGIVVEKEDRRSSLLVTFKKSFSNDTYQVHSSNELFFLSEIGDSIVKYSGNNCRLFKKDTIIDLSFYYTYKNDYSRSPLPLAPNHE